MFKTSDPIMCAHMNKVPDSYYAFNNRVLLVRLFSLFNVRKETRPANMGARVLLENCLNSWNERPDEVPSTLNLKSKMPTS